jgi:branched-chain amino acid transport system substrate-binding protein
MLLAVAACSGDDRKLGPALRVGFVWPYSGTLAPGRSRGEPGIDLAIAQINEAGGVLGQRIELVKKDGPDLETVPIVTQELLDEGVELIVGPYAYLTQAAQLTIPAGALVLSASQVVERDQLETGLAWNALPSFAVQSAGAFSAIAARTSNYVLVVRESLPAASIAAIQAAATQAGVAMSTELIPDAALASPDSYDFAPHIAELLGANSGGDWVLAPFLPTNVATKLLLQLTDSAAPAEYPHVYADASLVGNAEFTIFLPAQLADRVFSVAHVFPEHLAPAFDAEYRAVFQGQPDYVAGLTYDMMYHLALAIEAAGSAAPAQVAQQLRAVANGGTVVSHDWGALRELAARGEDIDYQGPTGPYDYDPVGQRADWTVREWKVSTATGTATWQAEPEMRQCVDSSGQGTVTCSPYAPRQ